MKKDAEELLIYLVPVDEPLERRSGVAVETGAVQVDPVAESIVVAQLVAGDHRKSFRQTYHSQLTALFQKLERRRVHRDLKSNSPIKTLPVSLTKGFSI